MKLFRKKPNDLAEAIEWNGDPDTIDEIRNLVDETVIYANEKLTVDGHKVEIGDRIVKNSNGCCCCCKRDIFKELYEDL